MKRSLVVGVDDTDDSKNALARAADLARADNLRLVVVHVRHIPVMAEMSPWTIGPAQQNLDVIEAAARRASEDVLQGTGLDWEFVIRSGDPAHELMAMADDRSAAAIVVGGQPHKAALSGLAGSVDAALVHRFHRSVLVIRGDDFEWRPVGTAPSEPSLAEPSQHEAPIDVGEVTS
jgi:nucleotide-binding universal stress UspA family protein